jgi:DNA-directed RNA polymerase II subunit RPB3
MEVQIHPRKPKKQRFADINPFEPHIEEAGPNLSILPPVEHHNTNSAPNPHLLRVDLKHSDVGMANALRRILLGRVPTLAIDTVEILENRTAIDNQVLSHRLGQLPLLSTQALNRYPEFGNCAECREGFNENGDRCLVCMLELEIDVRNDDNLEVVAVTGLDVRMTQRQRAQHVACGWNSDVSIVVGGATPATSVFITELSRGHVLKVRAWARLGCGREHEKWSPIVGTAHFQWEALIRLDARKLRQLSIGQRQKLVDSCPKKVLRLHDETQMVEIEDADRCTHCQDCNRCADHLRVPNAIRVQHGSERFRFTVETTGALSPVEALRRAVSILEKDLESLELRSVHDKNGHATFRPGDINVDEFKRGDFRTTSDEAERFLDFCLVK